MFNIICILKLDLSRRNPKKKWAEDKRVEFW